MKNPFQFGSVVGGDTFCNRKKEMADIQRAMQNGDRLFVYSERRLGKTSLVRLAMEGLPKKQFIAAYVDLLGTDDEGSFAAAVARALRRPGTLRPSRLAGDVGYQRFARPQGIALTRPAVWSNSCSTTSGLACCWNSTPTVAAPGAPWA